MQSELKPMLRGKLTALWTRDVDPSRLAGRIKMIQAIREEISSNYEAEHLRLRNVLEERRLPSLMGSLLQALRTVLTGHLPSLQCLLFCDNRNHKLILRHLRDNPPDILYCDGVRSFYFLQRLSRVRSKMRIVVDMDDLMSRRMQALRSAEISLSLGYLHENIPNKLRSAISLNFVSKAIATYEQQALTWVENRIGGWADAVVLISEVERKSLESRYRELGCKAKVFAIPPQISILREPQQYKHFSRFLFIGTDTLPQNKLTIQHILDLWAALQPEVEIHIFGHMTSQWQAIPGVVFRGYADDLKDVYADDTALFSPGMLHGGLKTKVLEAFAFGCAVVGNGITFEGLDMVGYPLHLETPEEIADILKFPNKYLERMGQAARDGQDYLRNSVSRDKFQRSWHEALGGP